MKRWALVVAGLYGLILTVLALPLALAAFYPNGKLAEMWQAYLAWQLWVWIAVMVLCQFLLLLVPVRVASRRPATQRSRLFPVVTAGLMMGGLAFGAILSVVEFIQRDQAGAWVWWLALVAGLVIWLVWAVVFFRLGRGAAPTDVVSRQCRLLLQGSVLELLIAVPTHIVARSRDYCCAGVMTFIGLTLGFSVMLFSFGPAVFFLYADRWRKLHPVSQGPTVN